MYNSFFAGAKREKRSLWKVKQRQASKQASIYFLVVVVVVLCALSTKSVCQRHAIEESKPHNHHE